MRKYICFVFVLCLGACDTNATPAALPFCRAIPQATPLAATIPLGSVFVIATTVGAGCPPPLVQNQTPAVIQLDSGTVATFRVTGLAIGNGRIRIQSSVDTLVAIIIPVTVITP
jgi:hypothetical protein